MGKRIQRGSWEDLVPVSSAFGEVANMLTVSDAPPLNITTFDNFVQDIFSRSYSSYDFSSWHIRKICATVDQVLAKPDEKYLLAVLPRGHLKSTILGEAAQIYGMLINGGDGFYTSYSQTLSDYHMKMIKDAIRNNSKLTSVMTDLTPLSDTLIYYKIGKRRSRVYSSGIGSVKRGMHFTSMCLLPDTKIHSEFGLKPIFTIAEGEQVNTHKNRLQTVSQIFRREICEEICVLYLSNDEIIGATLNHPVLTKKGFKRTDKLVCGDELAPSDFFEESVEVKRVNRFFYKGPVYNLEVENDHTFIGRGIIFHNCTVDDIQGDPENPMNLNELEKVKKIFNAEVMQLPNIGCPLFVVGTTMDFSDLLFSLNDNPHFTSIWLPAINPDPEHDVLWEKQYSRKVLESRREAIGNKAFQAEFLLVPALSVDAFIPRDEIDKVVDKTLKCFSVPGWG